MKYSRLLTAGDVLQFQPKLTDNDYSQMYDFAERILPYFAVFYNGNNYDEAMSKGFITMQTDLTDIVAFVQSNDIRTPGELVDKLNAAGKSHLVPLAQDVMQQINVIPMFGYAETNYTRLRKAYGSEKYDLMLKAHLYEGSTLIQSFEDLVGQTDNIEEFANKMSLRDYSNKAFQLFGFDSVLPGSIVDYEEFSNDLLNDDNIAIGKVRLPDDGVSEKVSAVLWELNYEDNPMYEPTDVSY